MAKSFVLPLWMCLTFGIFLCAEASSLQIQESVKIPASQLEAEQVDRKVVPVDLKTLSVKEKAALLPDPLPFLQVNSIDIGVHTKEVTMTQLIPAFVHAYNCVNNIYTIACLLCDWEISAALDQCSGFYTSLCSLYDAVRIIMES